MGVNKVQKADGTTLIDLTNDTVDANSLLQGVTAHDRSGAQIQGLVVVAPIDDTTTSPNKVWSSEKVNSNMGVLSNLSTTNKTNLVNAINEVKENGIAPHLIISSETGSTVTISNGTITLTPTETGSTGVWESNVPKFDIWTITSVKDGSTATITINVDIAKVYEVSLGLKPEGSTVLPTDDIQTWLKCGGIFDKAYTTIGEVLADTTTLSALINDNNASDYLVRSKSWTTANGLVPTMTSATAPSGTVISSGDYSVTYASWKAFDGNDNTNWASTVPAIANTTYIGYRFAESVTAQYLKIKQNATNFFKKYKVQGSNDGFTSDIHDLTDVVTETSAGSLSVVRLTNPIACQDYRLLCLEPSIANDNVGIDTIQLYYCVEPQGICDNSTAMAYIGANDYCADKLLSDSTWLSAICSSTYFESVLGVKVPTMTSNITPSGVAFGSTLESSNFDYYKAFNGTSIDAYDRFSAVTNDSKYVGYDFDFDVVVKHIHTKSRITAGIAEYYQGSINVQGMKQDGTWETVHTYTVNSNANGEMDIYMPNSITPYKKWRLEATEGNGKTSQNVYILEFYNIQFYGRASS